MAGASKKMKSSELEICKRERKEYLDGWKRAKADAINEKKHVLESLERGLLLAKEECIFSLLPVLDSLHFAKRVKTEGIDRIYDQCIDAFTSSGVVILDPTGEKFNPATQESVDKRKIEEGEDNTVLEVVRLGCQFNEKIIRPASVIVGFLK